MDQESVTASTLPRWAREPGMQPIPGYRLIEPLGRGGFGEVWKCEAPGGLYKAVKFVPNPSEQSGPAEQEHQALQLIKAIRHPFILSLDRVEIVEGVLVIVMELADRSLFSLLGEYQSQNLTGIPREELLGYLLEAAEALDWMNFRHGLQHLDIKPHNLFLISNHLKVADFGLVDRLTDVEKSHPTQRQGGITPLYAAPELLRGTVSRHCDQYSLAIVYQQLLTGTVPFWCQNMYQLMLLHLSAEPNLTPLPTEDRPIIGRVLSKRAEDRFPSCLDFMQALVCGESGKKADLPRRTAGVRKILAAFQASVESDNAASNGSRNGNLSGDQLRPQGSAYATLPTRGESQANTPPIGKVPKLKITPPDSGVSASPAREPSAWPAPTCVSLPGYRFLQCVAQSPLGDTWTVEDEQGRRRRALCLQNFVEQDPALIERLEAMTHPALPVAEVAWSPSGRLVLVTDEVEQTLRDRLEACQKQGLPGIPREELLGYLPSVAEALDALYESHHLPHLGLNPRSLLLRGQMVMLADFGLVPLIWLPTGQSAAALNGRYAAPELFQKPDLSGIPPGDATRAALMGRAGSASDQYSLALIYAELLNGIAPQPPRLASPTQRRTAQGMNRRGGRGDSGSIPKLGQVRVDLDLVPTYDRAILLRALHDDPQQRFASCREFVEALATVASTTARRIDLYRRLPAVIPFASLQGEPPPKGVTLPALSQFVLNLATPSQTSPALPRTIVGPRNVRFVLLNSSQWECKFPVQIFTGALPLKVEGFRSEWRARVAQEKPDGMVFHIDSQPPSKASERDNAAPSRLVVELEVQSASGSAKYFAEARMRIHVEGGEREGNARFLQELAPRLFDSMRAALQAGPEQRSEDRWQCPQPLHVYPVRADLELDEILDGISRNVSMGGVSFRVAQAPRTEQAYLHWHKSPNVSDYALLARIIRAQPMAGGGFEVGAIFPVSQ